MLMAKETEKLGHWESTENLTIFRCSECGTNAFMGCDNRYCPNCGTKMARCKYCKMDDCKLAYQRILSGEDWCNEFEG